MKLTRSISVLTFAALAAFAVGACGTPDKESPKSRGPAPVEAPATPAPTTTTEPAPTPDSSWQIEGSTPSDAEAEALAQSVMDAWHGDPVVSQWSDDTLIAATQYVIDRMFEGVDVSELRTDGTDVYDQLESLFFPGDYYTAGFVVGTTVAAASAILGIDIGAAS